MAKTAAKIEPNPEPTEEDLFPLPKTDGELVPVKELRFTQMLTLPGRSSSLVYPTRRDGAKMWRSFWIPSGVWSGHYRLEFWEAGRGPDGERRPPKVVMVPANLVYCDL